MQVAPTTSQVNRHTALPQVRGLALLQLVLVALAGSGLLLVVSESAERHLGWLRFIAFAPWLAILPQLNRSWAMLTGLAMGLIYIAPLSWQTFSVAIENAGFQGGWQSLLTFAFFTTYALPFLIFAGLDRRLQLLSGPSSLHALALLRAAVLASLISVCWTPFPYTPATMLAHMSGLAQWASLGGEPLLLWLLLWPSTALASLRLRGTDWRTYARALLWPLLALLLLNACGHWRIQAMAAAEAAGEGIRLSGLALQLDLPSNPAPLMLTRDKPGAAMSALELTRQAYAETPECELAVWPETPMAPRYGARVCAAGQAVASSSGKPVLMQCHQLSGAQIELTAAWWTPSGEGMSHAKSSLVPGYEVPWFGTGQVKAGSPGATFALDQQRRIIPALCYELYSNQHLRESVLAGGQFIAFMASFNAFARQPIERWNQPMAQLRAIAFGVPILRASNRADTGWIDANGRVRALMPSGVPGAQCQKLWSPGGGPTLFTYVAPISAWLPALLMLVWLLLRNRLSGHGQSRFRPPLNV